MPDKTGDKSAERFTAGVPLAQVITRKLVDSPEILMTAGSRSVGAERFRRLKTRLVNQIEGAPQVVVVTSAEPGEGKSFVSMNLALAFAGDKRGKTLLVDADLRRPIVGSWLKPAPKLGLADLLNGTTELDHAVLSLDSTPLKVLPAGPTQRDPAELLASDLAQQLMATLREQYRTIIIDTPPIIPFTDADVIGALSDGIIVVGRVGKTERSMFTRALASVSSTRILGTVLNGTDFSLADWNRPYDYYYTQHYGKDPEK